LTPITTTMPSKPRSKLTPDDFYHRKVVPHLEWMPWILRVTNHRDRPSPVLIIKHRRPLDDKSRQTTLQDRGLMYGESLRRCLPALQQMLARIRDENDRPLDLHQFLQGKSVTFRGNLPLDEGAGAKIALLFRLQERVKDLDRVELMALRIDSFTAEEATYWLSRILHFGTAGNRWAAAGMRLMLGGMPGDPSISSMLRTLRTRD
jgi:hypothetical protein